jgi:small subunit ribosomal protein S6
LAALYELILMLDPQADDASRDQVASAARDLVSSKGELKHEDAWGMRKLAYEIRHRTEADYRQFRFEAEPEVLRELDHSLKVADGVLRFRVFRVEESTPINPPPSQGATRRPEPARAAPSADESSE